MKMIMKKPMSFLMVLLLTLGMCTSASSALAEENNILQKNDKTATALDSNLETKVKLSFPGKQEILAEDIVFVLDKSGASAQTEIFNNAKKFLDDIKTQTEGKGLNIKVGVVLFNYIGNIKLNLTDIATGYDDILTAMNSSTSMGTNMHAGLLAAKKLLDEDTEVSASNKHIVLISDGATYLYCNDDDFTKAYTRSFGNPQQQTNPNTGAPYANGYDHKGGIWEYQSREYNTPNDFKTFADGKHFIFSQASLDWTKLEEYLQYYKDQDADTSKNWPQYEYKYNFLSAYLNKGRKTTPIDVNAPANIDVAFWKTDETFQQMYNAGYDMKVYFHNAADFDGQEFLKFLARNSNAGALNTDFEELKKQILDKIAKGSSVEDYIGTDFDFVNDLSKISIKVADETLNPVKVAENTYGFGLLADGSYRFVLSYVPDNTAEKLVLAINETVFPDKAVVLEYSEKLVNLPTTAGSYTFKTNESATLYPVDGNGKRGKEMPFPNPEVTYGYQTPAPTPDTSKKPKVPNTKTTKNDVIGDAAL